MKRGHRFIDLAGLAFGRLRVIEFHSSNGRAFWKCRCACGNNSIVQSDKLRSGHTSSCGCLKKERIKEGTFKHGMTKHPLYGTWSSIKDRCTNKKNVAYHRYGGRGIGMCSEWKESAASFFAWALDNGWSPELECDRIDNDGDYEPSNCRFITHKENCNNKSNSKHENQRNLTQ